MSANQNKLFQSLIDHADGLGIVTPQFSGDEREITETVSREWNPSEGNPTAGLPENSQTKVPHPSIKEKPIEDGGPPNTVADSTSCHGDIEYDGINPENVPFHLTDMPASHEDSNIDYRQIGLNRVDELFSKDMFCSLENTFEVILGELRLRLNEKYKSFRDEIQTATKTIVYQEMKSVLLTTQQLRDQVVSLRQLVKNQERMIARKDHVIDDLMTDLKRANHIAENNLEVCRAKQEEFTRQLTECFLRQRRMRKVFNSWKLILQGTWKSRYIQQLKNEAREEFQRLTDEYQRNKRQLETQLNSTRAELESTRATQAEENATLKMALMRGVCALNMETLTLFNKDARIHTGDSPVGTRLPGSAPPCTNSPGTRNYDTTNVQRNYVAALSQLTGLGNKNDHSLDLSPSGPGGFGAFGEQPHFLENPSETEAWPRQMPSISDPKVPNESPKHPSDSPIHHQSKYVTDWVGQSRQIPPSCTDKAIQSAIQESQPNCRPELSPSLSSDSNSHCVMELPVACTLNMNSVFSKTGAKSLTEPFQARTRTTPTGKPTEHSRRELNNRMHSGPSSSSFTNLMAKPLITQRAHTVQLGASYGPSACSSAVMASVHVQRHHPVSQVTLSSRAYESRRSADTLGTATSAYRPVATSYHHY
ncbi:hypothetical protein CSKR_106171 [Clonorchis sinensis]|uniref:Centrosomal protein POC5 n=1 Tax=Clonorchis sinensis TaxID=79923 RepID=A0A8T1M7G9_CLOSI|nr:hypothetical protein CSKR_106171 [Clonorchis sinensis]